jgi:hypothetical protein
MSLKPDKNGNISGYVKKEHHEKVTNNLNNKINILQDKYDELNDSFNQLNKNHEIFLLEYKQKCNEYNKLLLKLESKNVKKEVYDELQNAKSKLKNL